MNTPTEKTVDTITSAASTLVGHAAEKADQVLSDAKSVAAAKARQMQYGIDELRESVPSALQRAAAQAEDLTRRSIERAREASGKVRAHYGQAEEQAVDYIRERPMKAMLMAVAAGAATAMVVGWVGRSRRSRR